MRMRAAEFLFLGLAFPSGALAGAGIGTASCLRFALDYTRDPLSEEQYFNWAQGYLSAIVTMAPAGIDDNLNMSPAPYPKESQMAFIRSVCAQDPQRSYGHAVRVLYRGLGGKALD